MQNINQKHVFHLNEIDKTRAENDARYLSFVDTSTLQCGVYHLEAGSIDQKSANSEDRIYCVQGGKGSLTVGEQTYDCYSGTVLLVEANEGHRFHDIAEDLKLLIFFGKASQAIGPKALNRYDQGQQRAQYLAKVYEQAAESAESAQSSKPAKTGRSITQPIEPTHLHNSANETESEPKPVGVTTDETPAKDDADKKSASDGNESYLAFKNQLYQRLDNNLDSLEAIEELQADETVDETVGPALMSAKPPQEQVDSIVPLSADEYSPQQTAPTTDMKSMRDLANESSRTAISKSAKQKGAPMNGVFMFMSFGFFLAGARLWWAFRGEFGPMSLIWIALFLAGGMCAIRYSKNRKTERTNSAK